MPAERGISRELCRRYLLIDLFEDGDRRACLHRRLLPPLRPRRCRPARPNRPPRRQREIVILEVCLELLLRRGGGQQGEGEEQRLHSGVQSGRPREKGQGWNCHTGPPHLTHFSQKGQSGRLYGFGTQTFLDRIKYVMILK